MKRIFLIVTLVTLFFVGQSKADSWAGRTYKLFRSSGNVVGGATVSTSIAHVQVHQPADEDFRVVDGWYQGYTSTGTAGRTLSTGTISNTPTIITDYSFYVQGGDAQILISGKSGVVYIYNGVSFGTILSIPLINNVITLNSLTSGATFNYEINGGN